jgi:hypothetical protein
MLFVLRLTVLARLGLATVGALVVCGVAAADIGPVGVSPSVAQVGQAVTIRVQGYLGPKPWRPMPIVLVARHTGCFRLAATGPGLRATIPLAVPGPDWGTAGW